MIKTIWWHGAANRDIRRFPYVLGVFGVEAEKV
jgi:hypothetical protein